MSEYTTNSIDFDGDMRYKSNRDYDKSRVHDYHDEADKPKFNVHEPFLGIINIQMNQEFAERLVSFLEDIDGMLEPEIWAFKKAIADPQGCKDFRRKKKLKRYDGSDR